MKLTLLDIVQRVLSAMDSINISSITDDSIESEQVVLATQRVYDEILGRRDWPFLRTNGTLEAGTLAWELDLPETLMSLEQVKYNKKILYYKYPEDFQYLIDSRSTSDTNINSYGIYTDRDPSYYTSFNTETLVFDAYDTDAGASLIPSNSYIQYLDRPSEELNADTDVPALPFRFHDVLLKGVLAVAFEEIKQDVNKARLYKSEYKQGLSRMIRWANTIEAAKHKSNNAVDYGRYGGNRNYGRYSRAIW